MTRFLVALTMLCVSALLPANAATFVPSNTKAYNILNQRGNLSTKDGFLVSTVESSFGVTAGKFAILTYENKYYLYSVADKKFTSQATVAFGSGWYNVVLSNTTIDPIEFTESSSVSGYPVRITCNGLMLNVANRAGQTEKGVCLNTWTKADNGNHYNIEAVEDFDPTEALETLQNYFGKQVSVTYNVTDTDGTFRESITSTGKAGAVISVVPDNVPRRAYTTYTVKEPVTLVDGQENVVNVTATWQLPFATSPDLSDAHWYNLSLRGGTEYVTSGNSYHCNPSATRADLNTNEYQWAFDGNPYDGIIVYNRADITKTLAKVSDRAVLSNTVYRWTISENTNGFLLANSEDGKYINEYGGSGGYLGFWNNANDQNSIFTVNEAGVVEVENINLPTGAVIKLYTSSDDNANGRGILVIPGGGYGYVAGSTEGADWAPMFKEMGYTVAVLKYTTPPTAPDGPLTQARDAMRYLRENAEYCHTTTGQLGVMGFSAGGHLASTLATHTTGEEIPSFQILFYPVITMDANYTHAGSRQNLLGSNPSDELVTLYSNEKQVTEQTPMCYLCWAENDGTVPPVNSTMYAAALSAKSIPVHTKSFPVGGHGFGFKTTYAYHDQMVADLTTWMQGVDNILTGVHSVATDGSAHPAPTYYTLSGQRVSKPQHGLYVSRGQKVLVK